jgi:hypothetical protein
MIDDLSPSARRFVSAWLHYNWPEGVTATPADLAARAAYGLERPEAMHGAFCAAVDLSGMGHVDLAAEQWAIIDAAGGRQHADEALNHLQTMFTLSGLFRSLDGKRKH